MQIARIENGQVVEIKDYRQMFNNIAFPSSGPWTPGLTNLLGMPEPRQEGRHGTAQPSRSQDRLRCAGPWSGCIVRIEHWLSLDSWSETS